MLPLDGYVRVSQVGGREGEGFISPDVQERAIREWAGRAGVEVVMQRPELNVSGGTMDRPIFGEIMDRVHRGESGGIAVYKMDRFARSLLGAVTTMAELGEHGAVLASATEPQLDYTTPAGRAFMQQMFVFAEFTRSTLKESWAVAQRHAVERGVHISPNGFLGYDVGPDRRLVPNDRAQVVVEVFRRRARGETWGALGVWLNDVAPREDGTHWIGQSVQRLVSKRVYRGEASRYVTQDIDGRGPVVNAGAHPALVTEEDWRAAQMNPRVRVGGRRDGQPLALLAGLVRCAGCRYGMALGRGPKGERLYRCRDRHASGRCPQPASILADTIETHVENAIVGEIRGATRLVADSGDRERAAEALSLARDDLQDFRRDRAARRKLGAEWHDWLDEYLRAVREAEADLARLDASADVAMVGATEEHLRGLPVDDRREVFAGFIDCVMVRRSRGRGRNVDPLERRVRVLWRGQGPVDLPRRRVVNAIVSFDFEDDVEAGVAAAKDGG